MLGLHAAVDLQAVIELASPQQALPAARQLAQSLDEGIERRCEYLRAYQDARYAARYRALVDQVRAAERGLAAGERVTAAVARGYFKLLAYKDEYEVARLYSNGEFRSRLTHAFEGDYRLVYHFAPTWLAGGGKDGKAPRKRRFGPWLNPLLGLLAHGKVIRGSILDPLRFAPEQRDNRRWLADYEGAVREIVDRLQSSNHALAVDIASLPESIRGFGHVRLRNSAAARATFAAMLAKFKR
jgi:indolepyruvate ferredoxin oxidoreductase